MMALTTNLHSSTKINGGQGTAAAEISKYWCETYLHQYEFARILFDLTLNLILHLTIRLWTIEDKIMLTLVLRAHVTRAKSTKISIL